MEPLKNCPFCGGKAFICEEKELAYEGQKEQQTYLVYCTNCRATLLKWWTTEEEAIKAWNRRTNDGRFD